MARASVVVLALCMLLTGTINTVATKYQDIIVIGTAPDGSPLTFRHPAVQSACMFLGEALCLVPYFIMRWRRRRAKRRLPGYVPMGAQEKRSRRVARILAFAVPTLCDATGTSLMNIGLFYTYASTYQMLRGTLVLFAGAFTVAILRRPLFIHHWLGMVLITAGAALVGASSVIYADQDAQAAAAAAAGAAGLTAAAAASWSHQGAAGGVWHAAASAANATSMLPLMLVRAAAGGTAPAAAAAAGVEGVLHYAPGVSRLASRGLLGSSSTGGLLGDAAGAPLFGDMLVVGAQAFTALQFILEEKYLVRYKVPALLAVGLEGCWGLVLCALLLPVTSSVRGADGLPLDDARAALSAIAGNSELAAAVVLSIFSIAFFNFFGISVTKSLSGAARATIDACRTIFIWLYALHAGWERFHALEVCGFLVLISGTSLYNEIIKSCLPGPPVAAEPAPRAAQRRRTRASGHGGGGDAEAGLATPLLLDGSSASEPDLPAAARAGGSAAAIIAAGPLGQGRRAPPVPLQGPAPAHMRRQQQQQGGQADAGGVSGSWTYHMARSMRLGIHTLSPQSLAAAMGLAGDADDGEESGGSESGSVSSYYSSHLASSLGRSSFGRGSTDNLAAAAAERSPGPAGGGLAQEAARDSSGGGGMRVLRGFAGGSSPVPGRSSDGGGGGNRARASGSGVGGLTASLQAAAAAPASGRTPPVMPRVSSTSSLRRQQAAASPTSGGQPDQSPPPTQQQQQQRQRQ